MRIITGSARNIPLQTLEGEATRPTSDRAKEALFSMIQFDIEGRRCLDLFAGSGQLGLEALSRGAEYCVFCDMSNAACEIVISNAKKTSLFDKCRVSAIGFSQYLESAAGREKFDLIFLDPPYATDYLKTALSLISEGELLRDGGRIVCESDNGTAAVPKKLAKSAKYHESCVLSQVFGNDTEISVKYKVVKSSLYGRARITLLEAAK